MGKIYYCERPGGSQDRSDQLRTLLVREFGLNAIVRQELKQHPFEEDDNLVDDVAACDAMVVVMDPHWLSARNKETGTVLLADPNDQVRLEIMIAMELKIPAIPVLIDYATMPHISELPPGLPGEQDYLASFACRHAWQLYPESLQKDADALLAHIAKLIEKAEARRAQEEAETEPDSPTVPKRRPRRTQEAEALRLTLRKRWNPNAEAEEDAEDDEGPAIPSTDWQEARDGEHISVPLGDDADEEDDSDEQSTQDKARKRWQHVDKDSRADILAYLETVPEGAHQSVALAALAALEARRKAAAEKHFDNLKALRNNAEMPDDDASSSGSEKNSFGLALINGIEWASFAVRLAAFFIVGALALAGVTAIVYTLHAIFTGRLTVEPRPSFEIKGVAQPLAPDCKNCMPIMVIPEGRFTMGAPKSDPDRAPEEAPLHRVHIRPFAISAREVTVGEWQACVQAGYCRAVPLPTGPDQMSRPIVNVSWRDVTGIGVTERGFLPWLNEINKTNDHRLPTEAEWEFAARAGTLTRFSWGDGAPTCEAGAKNGANYAVCPERAPAPVASYGANPFGLYDMHGNVWELVQDCWHPTYEGAPRDGSAWGAEDGGDCSQAVVRGGSWGNIMQGVRSAYRTSVTRDTVSGGLGFRVAKTLRQAAKQ